MQTNYNRERKKGKHLILVERCIIEAWLKLKKTQKEIAERIGVSVKTIQREIKRGTVELLNSDLTTRKEYVAELAHERYLEKQRAKEGVLKIGKMQELADEIERLMIHEKYSPFAVLEVLKRSMKFLLVGEPFITIFIKRFFWNFRNKHLP